MARELGGLYGVVSLAIDGFLSQSLDENLDGFLKRLIVVDALPHLLLEGLRVQEGA